MIRIVHYRAAHQPWFEQFNRAWINRYFTMEKVDEEVLAHPEEYILKSGGLILMAYYHDEMAGTVAVRKMKTNDYEITKMAVDEKFRGRGIGDALMRAVLEQSKLMGLDRVILYSNTLLAPAIRMYRKYGFIEIPLEKGLYQRSNIKMEKWLIPGEFQSEKKHKRINQLKRKTQWKMTLMIWMLFFISSIIAQDTGLHRIFTFHNTRHAEASSPDQLQEETCEAAPGPSSRMTTMVNCKLQVKQPCIVPAPVSSSRNLE